MELVARKADLVRELQFFQQIVERKNTIPILANVLLEGTGNECTLLATDLEVALRSRCEAAVNKPGSVTLPAKKLYEVVRALPDGDVNIETDKNGTSVKVSGGQFSSKMPTLPREDFPSLPEAGGGVKFGDGDSSQSILSQLGRIPGLLESAAPLAQHASAGVRAAAAEFILEGLYASDKIGRTEERGFTAIDRKGSHQDLYRD